MPDWLLALIAAFAGLLLGAVCARIVRSYLSSKSRPDFLNRIAAPVGSLVFAVLLVVGLVTALGFVNEEALDQIPNDLVDYLPNALSALIVFIVGNVIATLTQTTVESALSRVGGSTRSQVARAARMVILTFAVILAAAQLGVDTTILNIAIAAALFSIGAGVALMIGIGSRDVASQVAAGRAVRRFVTIGDNVTVGDVTGTVLGVDSVVVQLEVGDQVVTVPNDRFLSDPVSITRAPATD